MADIFYLRGSQISVNRQKLSLNTPEEYNNFYDFIKTITISFKPTDTFIISNFVKQELAQPGYQIANDDPESALSVPAETKVFAVQNGRILVPGAGDYICSWRIC